MAPAANDPFAPGQMPVRELVLDLGASRINRQGEAGKPDELWRGTAFDAATGDTETPIFLRLAQPLPTVAELTCATLGRLAGLPVPEPFLVLVDARTLPGSRMLSPGQQCWAFASEDVGGDSFAQLLRRDSPDLESTLRRWRHLPTVAAFDEWVANTDRNPGNLVLAAGSLWIIDHADAFGGNLAALFGLLDCASQPFANLLGALLADGNVTQRHAHLAQAQAWLGETVAALDLQQAIEASGAGRFWGEAQLAELLDFLASRMSHTYSLLCHRLGIPQLLPTAQPQVAPQLAATGHGNTGASLPSAPSSSSPPA